MDRNPSASLDLTTATLAKGLFLPTGICNEGTESQSPMPPIAPGLRGYAIRKGHRFYVGWIEAEREGEGALGRWLDRIKRAKVDVRFSTVINARLAVALARRGWKEAQERLAHGEEAWTAWRPSWRCRHVSV